MNLLFLLVFIPVFAFAQTREDIRIYIAPVRAQDMSQALFFQENFAMELAGAGYVQGSSVRDSDYTLNLEVLPNTIMYDDGTVEQAPPDEKQLLLSITLNRNEDNAEIVSFAFLFDSVEEMYEYNLYLLYEALANVPMTRPIGEESDDSWRNKWIYARTSFDYPITFYELLSDNWLYGPAPGNPDNTIVRPIDHSISSFPAVTIGMEFQYLSWMSTELNFSLSFSDPMSSNVFIPAIQIEQKFPIKPSTHFMLEPYAVVSFPLNTSPSVIQFPTLGVGGGVQFGVKAGTMGAFFLDVNYIHFLGDVIVRNEAPVYTSPQEITYSRYVLGIGIGYKIGFFDRPIQ